MDDGAMEICSLGIASAAAVPEIRAAADQDRSQSRPPEAAPAAIAGDHPDARARLGSGNARQTAKLVGDFQAVFRDDHRLIAGVREIAQCRQDIRGKDLRLAAAPAYEERGWIQVDSRHHSTVENPKRLGVRAA
jgi:hypothetical protein